MGKAKAICCPRIDVPVAILSAYVQAHVAEDKVVDHLFFQVVDPLRGQYRIKQDQPCDICGYKNGRQDTPKEIKKENKIPHLRLIKS